MLSLPGRLRDESGVALVLALMTMTVMTIVTSSVIYYTVASQHESSNAKASDATYRLAEAGINNALAVLGLPANSALDPSILPASEPSSPSPYVATNSTGTSKWWGVLNALTSTWTVYGKGIVASPVANTASVSRQLSAQVRVTYSVTQPLNAQAWNYIYSTKTGDPDGCDEEIVNSITIRAPMYVAGNFCLWNSANLAPGVAPPSPAPVTNLVVQGSVKTYNSAHIGASGAANAINQAVILNGCNGHNPCRWNGGGDPVWANTVSSTLASPVAAPTADFDYWYQNASPGPMHPCATVSGTPPTFENEAVNPQRNSSVGTVNITPSASYTCKTSSGELSWDVPTHTLTVKGAIFIDGNVVVNDGVTNNYNGQASLYLNGTFGMGGSNKLCGGVSGGNCDFGSWNPNTELLLLVINGTSGGSNDYGAEFTNSSQFQGGVYATHAVHFENSVQQEGPLVASNIDFDNSVQAKPFPVITSVPLGTPGNPNVYAQPNPPSSYSG